MCSKKIMITRINESKTITKHVSFKCKCRFDGKKFNSNQCWNNDKYRCECEKHHACEKDYIWNLSTCSCKNGKYLGSIMDDSAITCDEIIGTEAKSNDGETKTIFKKF